jgi:multicomponent K+:H+ antiporter subunit E
LSTPFLSVALLLLWLALARSISVVQIIIGLTLALGVPRMLANLRTASVRVRRPVAAARFILTVGHDVLVSSVQVAWGVVAWRWRRPRARFVVIPLELRDPVGLAALAIVTTVVPGTVWSEIALDRNAVMLHVWNVDDEGSFIDRYKARYESPLKDIFE